MLIDMTATEDDDLTVKSPKYQNALASLPAELRPAYKQLVEEYRFHALVRFGRAWVAYDLLADLIRSGWKLDKM